MRNNGLLRWFLCLTLILFFTGNAFAEPVKTQNSIIPQDSKQIDKESFLITAPTTIGEWNGPEIRSTDEIDVPVTIGTGTLTSSIPSPYTDWYYSEVSCALYTAAEIQAAGGSAGLITHLRWYVQTAKTFPARTADIWLKQVAAETLPTQTYTQAITGATMVWSTTNLTEGSPAGAWKEFDITDFTWDGTSNLQVLFASLRGGYSSSTGIFTVSTVATGLHQYLAQDVTPIPTNTNLTSSTLRPNIQLELVMAPGAPFGPIPPNAATNVPTNATLTWVAGTNSSTFDVFFGTTNPPTTQVATGQAGTSWTPPALAATTTYYWYVRAFNTWGNTTGPVWSFTTGTGIAPNAPTNGAIVSVTSNSITASFTDNATSETGFPVFYSLNGLDYTLLTELPANPGTGTVTFTIPSLNPNVQYWARVFAAGTGGTSTGFAAGNAWTLANPAGPIVIGAIGFTNVMISSIPTTDGNPVGTMYRVMVNPGVYIMSGANPLNQPANLWANYNVTGLNSGATYNFRAIAVNGAGVEAPGPVVPVTTSDANSAGPDAFGYRYLNHMAPNGPTFNWIAPGGTTIPTTTGWTSTDDGFYTTPQPLGFTFNWYGVDYSQLYLCSNGYVTFDAGYGNIPYAGIMTTSSPGAGIFFWGRDMHVGYTAPTTDITIQTLGTQPNRYCVITFISLAQYAAAANRMDAQIIIYENGQVIVQYNNVNAAIPRGVIGIKALNGANGMNLEYAPALTPTNNTVIRYYRLGVPSNPLPGNAATNVPTNAVLTWNAAPAATGYNVYFGTENPPTALVSTNQPDTSYTPTLAASTTYYWQVASRRDALVLPGPIWSFTTGTGAAPAAPTGGFVSLHAITSLRMNWVDNSNNETGFPVLRSPDGATFTTISTAPANATFFDNTGLIPNTQYFYRVYAQNANATSIHYTSANSYTLAAVPGTPTISGVGITSVGVAVNNNTTTPNPATTQYAIRVGTQFVQTNGFLGASEAWQTLAQWGAVTQIGGLTASNTYAVSVKARNLNMVETAFSTSASFTTTGAFQLPLTQNFETATFPPPDWTVFNRETGSTTWTRFTDASGGMARVNFWNYSAPNHVDLLWSPPISTVGAAAVRVEWNWYYQDGSGYNDTVEVVYSLNGGTDWTSLWLRRGQGTGEEDLGTGTNGTVVSPGAFPTGWGHAEIFLPTAALNHPSILIGWLGRTNFGPDIFIDNIMVTVTGTAYLEGWVYQSNATPIADVNVQVRTQWTATTDMSGRWFIEIPAGVYPVRVWKPCWFPNPTLHDSVTILVGDTVRFVDTLYTPHMTASTNELSFIVPPGQILSQTLTLGNTGDWPYNFQARFRRNPQVDNTRSNVDVKLYARVVEPAIALFGPTDPNRRLPDRNSDFDPAVREPLNGSFAEKRAYEEWLASQQPTTPPVIDQTWGPDGYGYESFDNAENDYPTGVVYTDITSNGTQIVSGDDTGTATMFPTGFSFNYYGTTYNRIWVCTNGFIQFLNTGTGSNSLGNTQLPVTGIDNSVFLLWDDLVTTARTYYDATSNIYYIQWNGTRYGTTNPVNFQLQLHGDNSGLVMCYDNVLANVNLTPTIGIQGGNGANNFYIQNYLNVHPTQYLGYGIAFADMSAGGGGGWGGREYTFLVNPETGTVFPSQPMELFLQVTAEDSASIGFISTGNLFIRTNTCDSLTIPVTVEIGLSVEQVATNGLPMEYKLHQNFPNPFNPSTEIRFDLPKDGMTKLSVYNMLGQKVADLVNQPLSAGYQTVRFDASRLAAGVYFYRLESGNFTSMKKMVLVK